MSACELCHKGGAANRRKGAAGPPIDEEKLEEEAQFTTAATSTLYVIPENPNSVFSCSTQPIYSIVIMQCYYLAWYIIRP